MTSPRSTLRNSRGWIGATLAALAVVAGAAVGAQASSSGSTSSAITSTAPAGSSSANDPHEAAAQREVVQMLAAFQPPPGSSETKQPDPPPSGLDQPMMQSSAQSQVASVAWYSSSQSPDEVLAWLRAYPPTGSSVSGSGSGSSGPGFEMFAFAGPHSWLVVAPATGSDGRTVIRLDASVVWTPSRPAGSTLGYGASSVSVVTTSPMNPRFPLPADETATRTSTDPAVVHEVIDLVNALQPPIPGIRNCPADLGVSVRITLPGLATVTAEAGGCGDVTVTPQGGHAQDYAGADLIPKVYALFGVTWNQSSGLPPGTERTGAYGSP